MGKFSLIPANVVERTDALNYTGEPQIFNLRAAQFEQTFVDILVLGTQLRAKPADLTWRL